MPEPWTPSTEDIRKEWVKAVVDDYALVLDDADEFAGAEFDRWLNTTFVEPAARAAQQLGTALAARDRVFAAARAEIDNLDRARANGTIYIYAREIQERLRTALTPQPETTTTTTALAESYDTPSRPG